MNVSSGAGPQFRSMADLAAEAFDADSCRLFTLEGDGRITLLAQGGRAAELESRSDRAGFGAAEQAIRGGEPLILAGGEGSQMSALLRFDKEIIGAISVRKSGAFAFSESDLDLLSMLANHAATAVVNLRLKDASQRQLKALDDRARRLDLLNSVMRSLTGRMSIDELLDELLHLCAEAFELSHCALLLKDDAMKGLVRKSSIGFDDNAPTRIAFGIGITGHVAVTGVPVLVSDVRTDPRYIKGVSSARAEMTAPLRVFGEVIGVLDAESVEENAFDEEDLDLFTSFAAQAAVAIMSAELTAKLDGIKNG